MLANMGACAPKLFAIANDVVDHEDKAIQLSKLHIQLAIFLWGKAVGRHWCWLLAILDYLPCWSICEFLTQHDIMSWNCGEAQWRFPFRSELLRPRNLLGWQRLRSCRSCYKLKLVIRNKQIIQVEFCKFLRFNSHSNLRGEKFRFNLSLRGVGDIQNSFALFCDVSRLGVLVADAAQCSEGVSFFAVRRLHLADVPALSSDCTLASSLSKDASSK